jgi:hypothetical protein
MKPIHLLLAATLLSLPASLTAQQTTPPPSGEEVRKPDGEDKPKDKDKEKDKPKEERKPKPEGKDKDHHRGPKDGLRPEMRPTPFLGILAREPSPDLRAQAGLAEGFGLVVAEIMPESPAAKAGLKQHDVIVLLGDQRIVNVPQLSALVRAAGKDAEVEITVRRTGQDVKIKAKVEEKAMPVHPQMPPHPMMGQHPEMKERMEQFHHRMQEHRQHMERMGDHFRQHMRHFQEGMKGKDHGPERGREHHGKPGPQGGPDHHGKPGPQGGHERPEKPGQPRPEPTKA